MKWTPHKYQLISHKRLIEETKVGLLIGMGLGKTSVTLTAISDLQMMGEVGAVLVIAPKLVAEKTWTDEAAKWDHLSHLRLSRIIGRTPKHRIAALAVPADVYLISRDNIVWLINHMGVAKFLKKFKWVVVDEWSSFKSRTSQRFKALKKVTAKLERFTGLTGTPISTGLMDLWAQMFLLDQGERLEKFIGAFREEYFKPDKRDGDTIFSYKLRPGADIAIYDKIADVCISMQAEDWLDLKPRIDIVTNVYFSDKEAAAFKQFEKEEVLKLYQTALRGWWEDDEYGIPYWVEDPKGWIAPASAAGMYLKLLQFCNGAVYDDDKNYHVVSDAKLDMLEERIESLNGQPVIVFYHFKSDAERITARIKGCDLGKDGSAIDRWNAGKIKIWLLHPASASHGLNLQDGGHHIIWFGIPDSTEMYLQALKRLDRQGQKESVINDMLIIPGTLEDLLVKARLDSRTIEINELLQYLSVTE